MTTFDYDLFVIGAGSGGVRASRIAAQLGAKVAVAEELFLGGTCVNVGCVPKKLFVYGAQFHEEFEAAKGFGWSVGDTHFDWATLRDNKTQEIERLNGVYQRILDNANVRIIRGRAKILGPNRVLINDREITAERILIAVGGWPFVPEFEGSEYVIDSNHAFYLETFPKRVMVVGGGYIAVEFAGIFNGLGADTTLVYRGPMILRGFDDETRRFLAEQVQAKGINLQLNSDIQRIQKHDDGSLEVFMKNGDVHCVDAVMYATGRKPKTEDLGLENTKVELTKNGAVCVNDEFQTDEPSIYAVGDVIDRVALTPVALAEGMALARHLYDKESISVSYANIPTAVFSQPNVGTVGLSEEQAAEQYDEVAVYTSSFTHLKHTLSGLTEKTFMKLLVDVETDKVIGCHMVGHDAGEVVQGIAIAMNAGATKRDFDRTIGVHPSAAEEFVTMREPARVLRKS